MRHQLDGGGVLLWAGIINDELAGPFRVKDGWKINSQTCCQFVEDTLVKHWYKKNSETFQKAMIFRQDNAQSHTVWLASKGIKDSDLSV